MRAWIYAKGVAITFPDVFSFEVLPTNGLGASLLSLEYEVESAFVRVRSAGEARSHLFVAGVFRCSGTTEVASWHSV